MFGPGGLFLCYGLGGLQVADKPEGFGRYT
jgi:hypothetical protein